MKVFVAGATGALGRQLVPMLVAKGHEVVGMTRTESKRGMLAAMGAQPVVGDALDPEAVGRLVSGAQPEVIVHQLTAIPASLSRRFDRDFALTNRLRTEGTDHLLSAGRAAGVRRFVAQSFNFFERSGGAIKSEEDPLDPDPPAVVCTTVAAIKHLEHAIMSADWVEGVVLRYGAFYGPGTSFAVKPPGDFVELIRKRRLPIVGGGGGVWSFIHIEDAAGATLNAVEGGTTGIYQVTDDEPAAVRDWLPEAALALGAKRPLRLPRWLGRLAAGEAGVVLMTEARGASNAKAKRELDWRPRYPSWRQGFVEGLG